MSAMTRNPQLPRAPCIPPSSSPPSEFKLLRTTRFSSDSSFKVLRVRRGSDASQQVLYEAEPELALHPQTSCFSHPPASSSSQTTSTSSVTRTATLSRRNSGVVKRRRVPPPNDSGSHQRVLPVLEEEDCGASEEGQVDADGDSDRTSISTLCDNPGCDEINGAGAIGSFLNTNW
ncbi:hypothetical protein BC832DRAFT_591749 [Gaertneriomyces semiglobifer]|nr:hypothetical protein BC832DRAFT_591749 [Gaertneriomyces semiglobifer]